MSSFQNPNRGTLLTDDYSNFKHKQTKDELWYPVTHAQRLKEEDEAEWRENNQNASAAELFYPSMRKKITVKPEIKTQVGSEANILTFLGDSLQKLSKKNTQNSLSSDDITRDSVAQNGHQPIYPDIKHEKLVTIQDETNFTDNILSTSAPHTTSKKRNTDDQNIQQQTKQLKEESEGENKVIDPLWGEGMQITEDGEEYYVIASTPLTDDPGKFFNGLNYLTDDILDPYQVEHRLLVGANGKNFGRDMSGNVTNIKKHRKLKVENKDKYNAKYIEQAAVIMEERDKQEKNSYPIQMTEYRNRLFQNDTHAINEVIPTMPKKYDISGKNCKHYVRDLIKIANDLAKQNGESLIIK